MNSKLFTMYRTLVTYIIFHQLFTVNFFKSIAHTALAHIDARTRTNTYTPTHFLLNKEMWYYGVHGAGRPCDVVGRIGEGGRHEERGGMKEGGGGGSRRNERGRRDDVGGVG
jgi:hypothetical protein